MPRHSLWRLVDLGLPVLIKPAEMGNINNPLIYLVIVILFSRSVNTQCMTGAKYHRRPTGEIITYRVYSTDVFPESKKMYKMR